MRLPLPALAAFGCLALTTCPAVFAEETPGKDTPSQDVPSQDKNWYAGASFGGSRFDLDDEVNQIDEDVVQGGLFASSSSRVRDDGDSGLKAYFGYRWTKYIGAEFGFVSPGEAVLQTQVPGQLFVGKGEVSGWFGEIVATIPFGKGFSAHAKAGPFAWKFEGDLASTTTNTSLMKKDDGIDYVLGAGLGYEINDQVGARLEFEHFQFGDNSFDYISAGLLVRF